ncbi:MAG: hypothetical protein GC185_03205 [Alphaproteobacteria bacterium]|nr:hypothetical protein [Alphaproteobacteria bacterium]
MAQKRKPDQTKLKAAKAAKTPANIAEAAISLADEHGWEAVEFKDIARRAKCGVSDVEAAFTDIWAIIRWHLDHIDTNTRAAVEEYLGESWRDNLLEILMMRFELAQPHRAAWASLPDTFRAHPKKLRRFIRPFIKAMRGMLKLSGLSHTRRRPLLTGAFGAVYLSLLHTWSQDDTQDLSKTMAAIDKRLEILARIDEATDCSARKHG